MSASVDKQRFVRSVDCGAAFLSALAYPDNPVLRDAFAGAMICKAFDGAPEGPEDIAYEAVRLASVMQNRKTVATTFRQGARILNEKRLEAAFAARPLFQEAIRRASGCEPITRVPTHASKPMFETISSHIRSKRRERLKRDGHDLSRKSKDGGIDGANILERVWKESLPVLHMALALDSFIDDAGVNIEDILCDGEKLAEIIRFAEQFRASIASIFNIQNQFPALSAGPKSDMSKISLSGEIYRAPARS